LTARSPKNSRAAEEAFPGEDREGNDDRIADLELPVRGTDLDNFPHGFVSETSPFSIEGITPS
jgi:hypothetical protein